MGNGGNTCAVVISDAAISKNRFVTGDTTDTTNVLEVHKIAAASTAPVLGVTLQPTTAADRQTTVQYDGIVDLEVDGSGTAIDIGTLLVPTTGGVGIAASAAGATAQHIGAIALEPSAASGDVIRVRLVNMILVKGTA